MPPFKPIKRRELIEALRKAKFEGPFPGGNHSFMIRDTLRLPIPNLHQADIGRNLLAQILRVAGISREEWERL